MTHDSIKGTTAAQTSHDQIIASMFGFPVYAICVTVRSTMVDYSEACRMCRIHVAIVKRKCLPKSHKPYKRQSRITNPQSRAVVRKSELDQHVFKHIRGGAQHKHPHDEQMTKPRRLSFHTSRPVAMRYEKVKELVKVPTHKRVWVELDGTRS
jgi:hypothetical protein